MSIPLTVAGVTFNYPENRESPGWGEDATAWAEQVTSVLANVDGPGDILQTSANINNNVVSPVNVGAMFFDPTVVRGAVIEYSIYRVTTGIGATERVETGVMYLGYKSTAGVWEFSQAGMGGSGVTFSILSTGQFQYVSDLMTGSGYVGIVKFRARALII